MTLPLAVTVKLDLGIGYLLTLPLWIGLIGALSSRVLGVRIGRVRNTVAAIIGWAGGLAAGLISLGPHNQHPALVITLSVFFGVLVSLPVAIIIDVVTHGGRRHTLARYTLRHPVRATRAVLSPLGRFRQLVENARAENLLHVRYRSSAALASPDFAHRLRLVLERSGGMFIKFGQIAATRNDLLPADAHQRAVEPPLERQPAVRRGGAERAQRGARRAGRQGVRGVRPAAARGRVDRADASRQAARRTLRRWSKLQRPGLDELVLRDSAVLEFVARQLDRRVEAAHRIGIRALADELIQSIESELDYGHEAVAGMRLRENRADDVGVRIPGVHPTLSTRRLLVMDEIVGRSISDDAAVDAVPVSRTELARRLLSSFLGQILRDGYYHADPHPGNVMIDAEGTLWLLDFGAVGQLDAISRESLQGIAIGFALNDASIIARAVRHMVGDAEHIDMRQLERDMSVLLGEVQAAGFGPAAMTGVDRRHRAPRPATAAGDDAALARADHARGHAARAGPVVRAGRAGQRDRRQRSPRRARDPRGPGPEGADTGAPGAALASRARRGDREPVAVGQDDGADRAVRRSRPRSGRELAEPRPGRGRGGRRAH